MDSFYRSVTSIATLRNIALILAILWCGLLLCHIWDFELHIDPADSFGRRSNFQYDNYANWGNDHTPHAAERLLATAFTGFLFSFFILGTWHLVVNKRWLVLLFVIIICCIGRYSPLYIFRSKLSAAHDNIFKMYSHIKTRKEHIVHLTDSVSPSAGAHFYSFVPESWTGGEASCIPHVFSGSELFSSNGRANEWIGVKELKKIPAFVDLISNDRLEALEELGVVVNARAYLEGSSRIYTILSCYTPGTW